MDYISASMGKWHLGGPDFYPEHQGFEVNIAGGNIGHPASYFWPYGKAGESHRVPGLAEHGGKEGEYLTDRLTEEALKFIEANPHKQFFLYLAHYAVHAPLMGKSDLVEEYAERPGSNGQSNTVYAAMIQSVDESLGRLIRKLDELHLSDNTVIVFTSDNGGAVHFGKPPATSNAPLRLGKGYAYEGGLRVPLLIKAPKLTRPGSVCNVPVMSADFFPTLLELAGAGREARRSDGLSLVPLLSGSGKPPARDLFWHYPHYWNGKGELPVTPYSVVRSGDWKLIRFYEDGHEELYNLRNDLSEQHDLGTREPEKRRELAGRLERWLKEMGAQMPVERKACR